MLANKTILLLLLYELMCVYICLCFLVGQACGEAERDIQMYAGTTGASRAGTQTDTRQTRG